jgi:hypothetical protein
VAAAFARAGASVVGFDVDAARIKELSDDFDRPLFRGETDCAERLKPESRGDANQVVEIAVAHQVAEPDGLLRDNRKIDRGFDYQNGEDHLRSLGRCKPEQKKQPMEDQDAQ